jgi:hypothetical protein
MAIVSNFATLLRVATRQCQGNLNSFGPPNDSHFESIRPKPPFFITGVNQSASHSNTV